MVIVIIVHGLAEHLDRYDYLVEKFNSFGYGVYRFDNRGMENLMGNKDILMTLGISLMMLTCLLIKQKKSILN